MIRIFYMDVDFSEWLQNILIEKQMTQAELARKSGLSTAQISRLIAKRSFPGPDGCKAIASAFGLPEVQVFQAAGLLTESKNDPRQDLILYLAEQLPDEEYDDLIAYINLRIKLLEERGKKSEKKSNKPSHIHRLAG